MDDEVGDFGAVGGGGFELLDRVLRGVKLRRLGFGGRELSGGGVAGEQRGWGEEAFDGEEESFAAVAGGGDFDGAVVGDGEGLMRPSGFAGGRVNIGAAEDVLEGGDEQ